tara:strand:+ start:961 stop:2571 length:1611 start_codon:yes stop_codon:yes gene_type:complete
MHKLSKLFVLITSLFLIANTTSGQQSNSDLTLLQRYLSEDLGKVDSLFNELEPQYRSSDIDSLYAKFYFYGGILNYYKGNYILSKLFYKKAYNTPYASNNLKFKTRVYNNLGIAYELSQHFDSAYIAYNKSLEIERQLQHKYGEMATIMNIGLLRIKMKQYGIADSLLYKCLNYFTKQADTAKIGLCYQNIGNLYENMGDLNKSNVAAKQALFYFKKMKDNFSIGEIYYNLLSNNIAGNNIVLARMMLDSCKRYIDTAGYIALVRLPLEEALLISIEGDETRAIKMLDSLANTITNDFDSKRLITATKMDIYAKIGNQTRYRKAYSDYLLYLDSLDFVKNKLQIFQLDIINKTKEITKQLALQELLVQKTNREKGFIISLSLVLVTLLSSVILFKRRFAKLRSYIVNNVKNKELETIEKICSNTGKNELYLKVTDHLKKNELYLQTELKLETLAHELGTNISTLSKCINEASGDNFNQLINRLRVRHSEVLLHKNEHTISEIAEMVGFANRTSFYRSFKLITGLSPKEYKDALDTK